jgi:hypothetical protein
MDATGDGVGFAVKETCCDFTLRLLVGCCCWPDAPPALPMFLEPCLRLGQSRTVAGHNTYRHRNVIFPKNPTPSARWQASQQEDQERLSIKS